MQIAHDSWLSGVLGCDAFKVSLDDGDTEATLLGIAESVGEPTGIVSRPSFYYAKIATTRVDIVRALGRAGFSVVDVNVSFEIVPGEARFETAPSQIVVKDGADTHHQELREIAHCCFEYSRLHLDPSIPNHTARLSRVAWVDSYLQGKRGERLWVAESDGKAVGFVCELSVQDGRDRVGVIDLIGVAKSHQRLGVGKLLVQSFILNSIGRYSRLRVGTQVANIPSMRLYEACGFRVVETAYVLHAHLEDQRVRS